MVILNINSWSAGCCIWDDSNKDGMGVSRYVYHYDNSDCLGTLMQDG